MLVAEPRDRGDFQSGAWNDDQIRRMALSQRIGRMRGQRRLVGEDIRVTEQCLELADQLFGNYQRDAPALAGFSDSANRRIRVAPSRSCSIDVAYEMRR